ncbi:hypothetical protein GYMLUDRAFT_126512, partial [Collybiopsis luxurians FD-317 M1]
AFFKETLASVAYCDNKDYESGALGISPHQTYNAAPFSPVQLNFALPPADCPANSETEGYFFFYPLGTYLVSLEPYGMILNPNGTLVGAIPGILRGLQKYNGTDHIAVWFGDGYPEGGGHGSGYNLLIDNKYLVVANLTTVNLGVGADIHELQVTPSNTAIMTAYPSQAANLSAYGGPEDGYVYNSAFQEVDIATGEVLFTWQPLGQVDPDECYAAIGQTGNGTADDPWDYFHINSVQKQDDGNYLVSSRHCHALYLLDSIGDIIWQMGGKKSNFNFSEGANFTWQHHARIHDSSTLSVFNNGASQWEQDFPYSQGLLLNFDCSDREVSLINARSPFNRTVTTSQGSVQFLENGESIIGWGSIPSFSQHDRHGNIKWSAQFASEADSVSAYRVFLHNWVGRPTTPPSMQISNTSTSTNVTVYAWWNGATEVMAWKLFGSTAWSPLAPVYLNAVSKVDFETTLTYTGDYDEGYVFFQVAAMNANGEYLGYSN